MPHYYFRSPCGTYGISLYKLSRDELERVDTFPVSSYTWQTITYKRKPRNWPKLERGQCVRRKFTMEER